MAACCRRKTTRKRRSPWSSEARKATACTLFGRIEAHEAVTAFGRETLLQAKEIAEDRGFRMLHALTDSLWIAKAGTTKDDLLSLCDEITGET
jgi:DNA polymerase elongation subunit (family B)